MDFLLKVTVDEIISSVLDLKSELLVAVDLVSTEHLLFFSQTDFIRKSHLIMYRIRRDVYFLIVPL